MFPLFKSVVKLATVHGVSIIVWRTVANNVSVNNKAQKICLATGTYGLASLAGDVVGNHVEEQLDSLAAWWKKYKDNLDLDSKKD